MVKCEEFYDKFRQLQEMAKEIKGYCQVDARESIWRFKKYSEFCEKFALLPMGNIPERALRPLVAERNLDIAPIVAQRIKTRMKSKNPKDAQVTNRIVRRFIADARRNSVETPPYPEKKYRCLVIDPPWPMNKIDREERPNQRVQLDYPTLTIDEMKQIPIPELANSSGCHIFLWVTHRFLPQGLSLFDEWGVKYQCVLTWVKPTGMTPFSWMYNTEHVLFGRIGHLQLLENGIKLSFHATIQRHSEKPVIFYDVVRKVSPPLRLNLFARKERQGFEAWGNEVA